MNAHDWRKRAAWLKAVASRLPEQSVADLLALYAEEMLVKAKIEDARPALRARRISRYITVAKAFAATHD